MQKLSNIIKTENGVTLTELMVALGLLSFVLGSIFALLRVGEVNWSISTQRMQARDEISRASFKLSADLRGAKKIEMGEGPLALADANSVVFHANADSDAEPERIRYYLDGDRLVRAVVQPSSATPPWTYTGQAEDWVVARHIGNGQANPLFKYFDAAGNQVTSLPASSAQLRTISQVTISPMSDADVNAMPPRLNIETRIFLRNTDKGQ
ncbi:MAG TPA: hypothetical protein DE036_02575 [Actinobacteria bacterium]|nr:hypothetical protein [Actinomycetota bacterium]